MTLVAPPPTGPTWWPLLPALVTRDPRVAAIRAAWLMVGLLAVLLAFFEAKADWSGIPVTLWGVEFAITVYPPLLLTLFLALWLGPTWGASFAWLATFTSAVTGGWSGRWRPSSPSLPRSSS